MISVRPRGTRLAMPVVLLTGRGVFSSSESFVDAMRQEPSVLTLGDTTGGSSGNPVLRPFIDGWQYTVPTWQHRASDGTLIEGHGIPPERHVPWDADAARVGRDVVLESAVALLRAGRAGGAGP
jgi:C-terminal processing protease CtpA/Prc